MKCKRTVCMALAVMMVMCLFPAGGYAQEEPAGLMEEAVELGIAWEELLAEPERPITVGELVSLMENALAVMGKSDANESLLAFSESRSDGEGVQRHELAQLLYGVYQDVTAGYSFPVNAAVIYYEAGGGLKEFHAWDCPDYDEINELTCDDMESGNYAVCAFDRTNGDKLMPLYDDWTFRPTAEVTVQAAVGTVLRFSRSFEKDPVFVDVTDEAAGRHTIDPALYTGGTTLPDATNQDLPLWRGCNIGFRSMFNGALGWNPDDSFVEGNLDYIKELGMNYVRLRLTWGYFQGPDFAEDNVVNLSRLEQLDEIISWCMERDIHVQLVFSDVPNLDYDAVYDSIDDWYNACNAVFTDETVRDNVTVFWRMLARRYADIPNNYLSFNLMNECVPADDENYVWAFADAVNAIWEQSPGRVIVADVLPSISVTGAVSVIGASMAELGCALSYHFYDIKDISMVSPEKEAAEPGFYESLTGMPSFVNANIYSQTFGVGLPEEAKGALRFTGAVGGATLSVTVGSLASFDTTMRLAADGQTLYEGMEPYTYDEATDYIGVNVPVTVTIPEGAGSFEIACPEGGFSISDISLRLSDGTEPVLMPIDDWWAGMAPAEVTVGEDGKCTSTLSLADIRRDGMTFADLVGVVKQYGVDIMVGECGIFEGGDPMAAGISQAATEAILKDEIDFFEGLGLAWACEYVGRYALVTPAPYLEGVEFWDLDNSPYYANVEMGEFLEEILAE